MVLELQLLAVILWLFVPLWPSYMPRHSRGDLRVLAHTPGYELQLKKGLSSFKAFLRSRDVCWQLFRTKSVRYVDNMCRNYVQAQFDSFFSRHAAVVAVLAVQRQLRLRGQLQDTWAALKSWHLQEPMQPRRPFSYPIFQGLWMGALCLAGLASSWEQYRWLACVVMFKLAFHGLFRPGELLQLRAADIAVPDCVILGQQEAAVVIVRNPKNRRFLGRQQFVLIEDRSTILWLAWWVNGLKKEDKLFPGGRYSLLKLFNSVLTTLHLSGMGFTLASFRTSGATFLFRSHGNLGKLQYHGRWCSLNSLQHYLQEAMSALLASQVPEQAKAILTALNNSTAVGMNPPACAPNHQLRHGRSDSTARGPDPRSAWPTVSSRRRRRPRKER